MVTPLRRSDRWQTEVLPQQQRWIDELRGRTRDTWTRARRWLAPVERHIRDHGLSWAAMGFIDAAAFVHSNFTGLLVTGILLFLFELKIGEGGGE